MSEPASQIIAATQRPNTKKAAPEAQVRPGLVALFDLDATLFDYGRLRIEATTHAIEGMVSDPVKISTALFELLRPSLADLLAGLGFQDLRRGWDSPEVLIFAGLLEDQGARSTLFSLSRQARQSGSAEDKVSLAERLGSHRAATQLREASHVSDLLETISEVKARWHSELAGRSQVFREYVEANATLAAGARELISHFTDYNAEIHVVSEGDSAIQRFKFESLRLSQLVQTCVVTDATCGVLPLLDELFLFYKDAETSNIPAPVIELYDSLAPYTIKSPAFFTRLLHALVDPAPGSLQERMEPYRFLTKEEWQGAPRRSVVMVGDRYRKDIEPLLRVCTAGIQSFRVLTGRYYKEDPLHEIFEQGRPMPTAFVPGLEHLVQLAGALRDVKQAVERPVPLFPGPHIIEAVLARGQELSERSKTKLLELKAETLRHEEIPPGIRR